jgi:hypothetical protein
MPYAGQVLNLKATFGGACVTVLRCWVRPCLLSLHSPARDRLPTYQVLAQNFYANITRTAGFLARFYHKTARNASWQEAGEISATIWGKSGDGGCRPGSTEKGPKRDHGSLTVAHRGEL